MMEPRMHADGDAGTRRRGIGRHGDAEMRRHGKIGRFLQEVARPLVARSELESAYKAMAADRAREAEALEWAEATIAAKRMSRSTVGNARPWRTR
jgi:hypothetical protein